MLSKQKQSRHVTNKSGGEGSSLKIERMCSGFGKKYHNYIHLLVKFSLKMLFLKGIWENSQKCFPADPFFVCSRLIVYQSAIIFRNLSCPETFLVAGLSIWLFEKTNSYFSFDLHITQKRSIYPEFFCRKAILPNLLHGRVTLWLESFMLQVFKFTQKVLRHHCFPIDFPNDYKLLTWLTK